ncbi:anthranilate synthase component I family protein [Wenyingzhuangia aestuarii]|uniref:anthranilate synthase component I family protein n=1 Tax=Wenyingzhuangia aestuarii TaxID=1647582 RepID=UPI001438F071|nr:anthranilate synthase component I family protein [Wenyingzhuangia aestuarii]NJB84071.1 para-aminobenzoate synthetase component 1 [Wenyingzhuangia aestuarii]
MQRIQKHFSVDILSKIKEQILIWGNKHSMVAWLDSNENSKSTTEGFLAVQAISILKTDHKNAFDQLKTYINSIHDYAFGYLSYDLKNDVETLSSNNIDASEFPDLYFFQPEKLIEITKDGVLFRYPDYLQDEIETDWNEILQAKHIPCTKNSLTIKSRVDKNTYIKQVEKALQEIHLGEVYELNYCQEFYAENASIAPLETYFKLNSISTAPFASYLKLNDLFLLSGSPERFLKKHGETLLSEPIKGTAKRRTSPEKDIEQIKLLKNNTKEIAENIMIVDLVRNDLSHIAKKGSVKVNELCKIYTFKQVHQMISSITCNIKENIHAVDAIKACYPMGSMTGAPKIAAMNFIEELEASKRGIYSGAVGYFTPNQDFDFNVVIRSIVYNQTKKHVSFSVGSAITAKANPEKEYEECLLKAKAMREVLTQ